MPYKVGPCFLGTSPVVSRVLNRLQYGAVLMDGATAMCARRQQYIVLVPTYVPPLSHTFGRLALRPLKHFTAGITLRRKCSRHRTLTS